MEIPAKILPVKDGKKSICTIISDDGDLETAISLSTLGKVFGIKISVAGVARWIGKNLNFWKKMESSEHIEIINHSWSHMLINDEIHVDSQTLIREYVYSHRFFKNHFKTPQFTFVPPNNQLTEKACDLLRKNSCVAIRRGQRILNSLSPENGTLPGQWFNLGNKSVGDVKTTDERNAYVRECLNSPSWLIEMWHNVTEFGTGNYQPLTIKEAAEHIEFISKQDGLWVAPFTEATSYVLQRQNSAVCAQFDGEILQIEIRKLNSDLPWELFNSPLTIEIKSENLPHGKWDPKENGSDFGITADSLIFNMASGTKACIAWRGNS